MHPFPCIGSIDGDALIHMNNVAVGYFPSKSVVEIGVYPVPMPVQPAPTVQQPQQQPVLVPCPE